MIKPEDVQNEYIAGHYQEECTAAAAIFFGCAVGSIAVAIETEYPGGDVTLGAVGGVLFLKGIGYARRAIAYHRRALEIVANDREPDGYTIG